MAHFPVATNQFVLLLSPCLASCLIFYSFVIILLLKFHIPWSVILYLPVAFAYLPRMKEFP